MRPWVTKIELGSFQQRTRSPSESSSFSHSSKFQFLETAYSKFKALIRELWSGTGILQFLLKMACRLADSMFLSKVSSIIPFIILYPPCSFAFKFLSFLDLSFRAPFISQFEAKELEPIILQVCHSRSMYCVSHGFLNSLKFVFFNVYVVYS